MSAQTNQTSPSVMSRTLRRAFTDEVVAKVEAHGVYRVGYPDRGAAERLVAQLREAIALERMTCDLAISALADAQERCVRIQGMLAQVMPGDPA